MSAWWLLAGALLMCAAVLLGVVIYENWYHWRDAAHVAGDPVEPGYVAHVAGDPVEPGYVPRETYGSLVMLEEAALHHEWLPAPTVDPAPWLEQTRADLAPAALDPGPGAGPARTGYNSRLDQGSYPKADSPAPAPAPAPDDEPLSAPPPSHPVWRNPRLRDPGPGDVSSSIDPGPVKLPDRHDWHRGHRPGEALGPRACAVLDRYERRLGARMAAAA